MSRYTKNVRARKQRTKAASIERGREAELTPRELRRWREVQKQRAERLKK